PLLLRPCPQKAAASSPGCYRKVTLWDICWQRSSTALSSLSSVGEACSSLERCLRFWWFTSAAKSRNRQPGKRAAHNKNQRAILAATFSLFSAAFSSWPCLCLPSTLSATAHRDRKSTRLNSSH